MKRRTDKVEPLIDRRQLRFKTAADVDVKTLRVRTGKGGRPDEFLRVGVLLRHETKEAATRRLRDERSEEDFSDLVERLLGQWLAGDGAIKTPSEP